MPRQSKLQQGTSFPWDSYTQKAGHRLHDCGEIRILMYGRSGNQSGDRKSTPGINLHERNESIHIKTCVVQIWTSVANSNQRVEAIHVAMYQ